jgi:aerobic-type carbon monoxide dehydrogenase small subunit (CoxS/CutS family)
MAGRDDLFDEEPEQPDQQQIPEGRHPGAATTARDGLTRRRLLFGAGVAAAGAAVGAGATAGVMALRDGGEEQAVAPAAETEGMTLGVPEERTVSEAVVKLTVNDQDHWLTVGAGESLAEVLRRRLGLTGTKIGCDRSECSACAVIVDGVAQNSCSLLAIRESGRQITTIEGLEQGSDLSPVQQAFWEHMGLQCGFCTPGQIMQATALLQRNPTPDEAEIRRAMSGNLCKCGAYPNILAAVQAASKSMVG